MARSATIAVLGVIESSYVLGLRQTRRIVLRAQSYWSDVESRT
jgi:hypothetical protein